jgi:hypothetical protein
MAYPFMSTSDALQDDVNLPLPIAPVNDTIYKTTNVYPQSGSLGYQRGEINGML